MWVAGNPAQQIKSLKEAETSAKAP
jgi:hypothetical protein